jgi:hypothetical protein
MANSIKKYEWSGTHDSSTVFSTPDFQDDLEIRVYVNGVEVDKTGNWALNEATQSINFFSGSLPNVGDSISIERHSSFRSIAVDFSDGAVLNAEALDTMNEQLFNLAHEAYDQANVTNLGAAKFYYAQGTAPQDVEVGTLWYNTASAPNYLQYYDGENWNPVTPTKASHRFDDQHQSYVDVANNPSSATLSKIFLGGRYSSTSSNVYLNGVKLKESSSMHTIPTEGDYHINSISDVMHLMPLTTGDELEIETLEGAFVARAEEVEQHVDDYNNIYLPRMEASDQLAQNSIQANTDINQTLNDMGGLSGALNTAQQHRDAAEDYAEDAQKFAGSDHIFSANLNGTYYGGQRSAKFYRDQAQQLADTTIPNQLTSAQTDIETARSGAITDITTQEATSISEIQLISSDIVDHASNTEAHKNAALAAKEASEAAANVSADVLNGWATVANNVLSTYGSDDTSLISSTNLSIAAPEGVVINDNPTPKFTFVLDLASAANCRHNVVAHPTGASITFTLLSAGNVKVELGSHPASAYYYADTGDYHLQAFYQGNAFALIKANKATEYFEIEVEDVAGNAITTGEVLVHLYEF